MRRYSVLMAFSALSLAVPMACQAQTQERRSESASAEEVAKLDASQLALAGVALDKFRKTRKMWQCFDVNIYPSDVGVQVDFTPRGDVIAEEKAFIVNASKCGRGISYIINKSGSIDKIILSR